jgi:protein AFG1
MPPNPSTGLTITNPLVLYRSLLATKRIEPDPSQHRLALKLQELYHRLKDYSPHLEYGNQLKAISSAIKPSTGEEEILLAVPGHPLRRNPLFSRLFARKEQRDTLALTRVFSSHEKAINLDSPRGLLLHGEVGTGKSLMIDLLADCLPNSKKKRWHFNTFMLETLARLEQLRKSRSKYTGRYESSEHSLLWLAKDMIESSPILFLDEFQLPDRAASKILSNLLTSFFQLGGVLIASSNRMPDELAKASGMNFGLPPRGRVRNWLGLGASTFGGSQFPANDEYAGFVEVLKARCEICRVEGSRDWRRREVEEKVALEAQEADPREEGDLEDASEAVKTQPGNEGLTFSKAHIEQYAEEKRSADMKQLKPNKYLLISSIDTLDSVLQSALPPDVSHPVPWQSTTLLVYGRQLSISKHLEGVTSWNFEDLCGGTYGPADYITLASTFHTFVVDGVPILNISQKNEARRLITLLDALYEARCKLVIRAEAGPDDIFFPEINLQSSPEGKDMILKQDDNGEVDAVYPETISEIYQDQTSPFRPNISTYRLDPKPGYDLDQDSDFGPIPSKNNEIERHVDFGMTNSFTGEDEKFAYKRARSRLWEMCSSRWHERSEPGWWKPLPIEVRRWERSSSSNLSPSQNPPPISDDVRMGEFAELDRHAGLQRRNPIDESSRGCDISGQEKLYLPPKFNWTHAWGMIKWGKKAGSWGQGPEGLEDRKGEGQRSD